MRKFVIVVMSAVLFVAGVWHFAPSFKDPVMLGALVIAVALGAGAIWLLRRRDAGAIWRPRWLLRLRDKRQGQSKQ